jgi:hypothetical protein
MRLSFLSLGLFFSLSLFGQHRIAIFNVQTTAGSIAGLGQVSSQIVAHYASDDRFIVIDKANIQLIKDEQDRQKSEEFIDGYIVNQGKQEGFEYCYYPIYDKKEKLLSVKVYDIEKGTVISNQEVELGHTILGTPKNLQSAINKVIEKVNADCFELRYEILRCTDKKMKSKAKNLLFAIGYNQRAKENDTYEIYKLVVESVGGKEYERKEVIAMGEINEIQDANFSILKVTKNGEAVMNALNANEQLYGALIR